ncbi:methanethiol oxidase [Cloeon dipterum]|uniref:methanethiol oxidase n=1 Tax=Cloeon dipterum TaxID=197152 RepID=UPI00322027FB
MSGCCSGPGYATPLDAMKNGPKEKILYVICVQPEGRQKPDYLATVDVDPESPSYCQVISRCYGTAIGDEFHHFGWNSCSSCHGDPSCKRDKIIIPCLGSDRIYVLETGANPKEPKLHKVLEPSELHSLNLTAPHTAHCLASGEVMISAMGDVAENGRGGFALLDCKDFTLKGPWSKEDAKFGYDFWYQPLFNIMVSSEWGAPKSFRKGFIPEDCSNKELYGNSLNFFSWNERKLLQTVDLGAEGVAPLEIRFLHNPKEPQGYVGCALNAIIYRFFQEDDGKWNAEPVVKIPKKKVEGWPTEMMAGMMTDILISLDDRFLCHSNWLHGDVRQYDITDRRNPKLVGQLFLGGSILSDSKVKVLEDQELTEQPKPVYLKGRRLHGAPQMLQLSLDGKRLYITSSLFSPWDKQFYPEMTKNGSVLVRAKVDVEKGGLELDEDFIVDFGKEPDGPVLAHEVRYPGGDCTSDIWLHIE